MAMLGDRKVVIIAAVSTTIIALVVGIIIGYFSAPSATVPEEVDPKKVTSDVINHLIRNYDQKRVRDNLKVLSAEPHMGATSHNTELAHMMYGRWKEAGLDDVRYDKYNILLSYPVPENPNKVRILDHGGEVIYESHHKEKTLRPEDRHPEFVHAFTAYSPSGDVRAPLVYVNYGRVEDFDRLEELGVVVNGTICLLRYGKLFRGNKLQNAYKRGAVGVILFSDPKDVAQEGTEPGSVYPNTYWLPGSGVQRGNVILRKGDPLTPLWPSVDGVYRIKLEDAVLPKIPCQPIGYTDAKELLLRLGGVEAPVEWRGGIKGITYRVGPGFRSQFSTQSVQLSVNNILKVKKVTNVIGWISGRVEPDRYVLLGNHRDAWGYGAVDPNTGTASFMENVHIFGDMKKRGWRPRRTLVFCSWDAEEFGIMGSTEWVEDHLPALNYRAVIYINSDVCVLAPYNCLEVRASPQLKRVMLETLDEIPSPAGFSSLTEHMLDYQREVGSSVTEPSVIALGGGSDHVPFVFYAGIPSTYHRFKFDKRKSNYAAYHTGFETFYLVDKFIDPGYKYTTACGQISSVLAEKIADSVLIPYNFSDVAFTMQESIRSFSQNGLTQRLHQLGVSLSSLEDAVAQFAKAAADWQRSLSDVDLDRPLQVRMINDQALYLERIFLLKDGIPGRPEMRDGIFAPSKFNVYASSDAFPGISDSLHKFDDLDDVTKTSRVEEIKKHVSDLMIAISQAARFLGPLQQV